MRTLATIAVLAGALCAASCGKKEPPAPPPAEVQVATVTQRDEPIYSEWIGTLDGMVNAEIRPKVDGYVLKQLYREGTPVAQGAVLFEIDPRQSQASLDQAKGTLARAVAAHEKAVRDVKRYTPLAADKAISQEELDNARSTERETAAAIDAARANVDQAKLDRAWTQVTSPIAGIAGIAKAQVGQLVSSTTVMTTVSQLDPIKVSVNISEQEYLRYAKSINAAGEAPAEQRPARLELVLDDGSTYPQKGRVISIDRQVDVRTGTMAVQGAFPNPGNILRPGQYAKVRVALETRKNALIVPQRAVNELQGSFQVGVVGKDGKAEIRAVQPGQRVASNWVIDKGLQPGERVITEGFARVRAGQPVVVKDAAGAGSATASTVTE